MVLIQILILLSQTFPLVDGVNMKRINLTFVYCALLAVGGGIWVAVELSNGIDGMKKNSSDLKAELSVTLKQVKSDCKAISKEKQFDSRGQSTIIERYSCADGIDYSFSMPSKSNQQ